VAGANIDVLDVIAAEERRMKEREAQREIEKRNIKAAEKQAHDKAQKHQTKEAAAATS
jgi:hypothetical protein